MSKKSKRKNSQFSSGKQKSSTSSSSNQAQPLKTTTSTVTVQAKHQTVKPEQVSLDAHTHIQKYLKDSQKTGLEQEDLNAVLRLSQHLRVFGLLSAVGYINQSNDQEGKVRKRTVPVWKCLLEQLFEPKELQALLQLEEVPNSFTEKQLMEAVKEMADKHPSEYMSMWRKSLVIANHWNFWARAYAE
ncbi:MAG: hypothetical protein ACOC04_03815 [Halothece sp.]